ncbi:hypothetical protein SEPCBS57363_006770 [Sporothrix epigloea]|uniref:Uncharacterized protein n=1 Tax=Sporothrix epigloea TaxID=1892477 RepID=A0ABP0E806_9PEZI
MDNSPILCGFIKKVSLKTSHSTFVPRRNLDITSKIILKKCKGGRDPHITRHNKSLAEYGLPACSPDWEHAAVNNLLGAEPQYGRDEMAALAETNCRLFNADQKAAF